MSFEKNKKLTFLVTIAIVGVSIIGFSNLINTVTAQSADITSYSVSESPNWNAPGTESFWSNIPWTTVSLSATVTGGGHTSSLQVKSAHNATSIFVLETWSAPTPSYKGSSAFGFDTVPIMIGKMANGNYYYVNGPSRVDEQKAVSNGTLVGLVYNSTFYYPDRAAIMWGITASADCMNLGANGGALGTGSANVWEWEFGATDNSSNNPAWSGWTNTTATGTPAVPTHSFAINLYTNTTDIYQVGVGGNTAANWYDPVPGTVGVDPFNVWTAASYSNGKWTLEYARTFTTSSAISSYEVQLSVGKTYNVAFAVWQGYQGESAFVKSYSPSFQTLAISSSSPPPSPATSPLSGALLLIVTIIIVIVIAAALIAVIYKKKK